MPSPDPAHVLSTGTVLNERYRVDGVLGAGAFGITYQAVDTVLSSTVVIKELYPEDYRLPREGTAVSVPTTKGEKHQDLIERVLTQGRLLRTLEHPHLMSVYGAFKAHSTAYLVVEHLEGASLRERLDRNGTLPETEVWQLLEEVGDGLSVLHEEGALHLDLKPANIVKASGRYVVIDYGAGRMGSVEDSIRLSTGGFTPEYAAIEQTDDRLEKGSYTDIYALGVTAYECLTGKLPPKSVARLMKEDDALSWPDGIDDALHARLGEALRVRPEDRPASVEAWRSEPETVEIPPAEEDHPEEGEKKDWLPERRVATAALPVVALAILIVGLEWGGIIDWGERLSGRMDTPTPFVEEDSVRASVSKDREDSTKRREQSGATRQDKDRAAGEESLPTSASGNQGKSKTKRDAKSAATGEESLDQELAEDQKHSEKARLSGKNLNSPNGYTWEEEVWIGRRVNEQMKSYFYKDQDLQRYVESVGKSILSQNDTRQLDTSRQLRDLSFHFHVLDSPTVNAFVFPGGYIYVTRGLLAHVQNEAQLAVVLGHQIGHVVASHTSQQMARQSFTAGPLLESAIFGEIALGREGERQVFGLGGMTTALFALRFTRENERVADRLGVEYVVKAGYAASEGADLFRSLGRMQEQDVQSVPGWQLTHSDPGSRVQRIQRLAQGWREKVEQRVTIVNQGEYYDAIERIILGNNPREGFLEGGIFYHPDLELRFSIPDRWTVHSQARQVLLTQPTQSAYMFVGSTDASTPEAAAHEFTQRSTLTVLENSATTVRRYDAQRVLAEGKTQQGQSIRQLVYFVDYNIDSYNILNNKLLRFHGITTEKRYDRHQKIFKQTINSLNRISDQAKLNMQSTRIAIRPAAEEAAFRAFIDAAALPQGMTKEELGIINQLDLDETVPPSRPLKLPR